MVNNKNRKSNEIFGSVRIEKNFGDEADSVIDLCASRSAFLIVIANLPFILCPFEYIKLAQVERKLASHGIYFPTKYPLGFNRLAEWYILNQKGLS